MQNNNCCNRAVIIIKFSKLHLVGYIKEFVCNDARSYEYQIQCAFVKKKMDMINAKQKQTAAVTFPFNFQKTLCNSIILTHYKIYTYNNLHSKGLRCNKQGGSILFTIDIS
jgi:hypothetical protein